MGATVPTPPRPAPYNRDAILTAVDLPGLADELLGPHKGSARSPTWPCPNPDHPQTGRTPPVTVFMGRTGEQRWHCHGCGNRGSAIDLVMQVHGVDVRGALDALARRSGLPTHELTDPNPGRRRQSNRPRTPEPAQPPAPRPVPAFEEYVAQCAEALWRPEGKPVRRWLTHARRLPEDVLRVNRVGADPGRDRQPRPNGIAEVVSPAAVLPVLVDNAVCFVQLRVLGWPDHKYLNPPADLAPNPRVGLYRPARHFDFPFERRDELIVTEGIIDALSAAAGGYHAAAVLGAGYTDPVAAIALARLPGRLVIAFDPDPEGRTGAERLIQQFNARHRRTGVMTLTRGDLNKNLQRAQDWPVELAGRVQHATARSGLTPPRGLGRAPHGR